eukprot:205344-Amphidinium_carterae.1
MSGTVTAMVVNIVPSELMSAMMSLSRFRKKFQSVGNLLFRISGSGVNSDPQTPPKAKYHHKDR